MEIARNGNFRKWKSQKWSPKSGFQNLDSKIWAQKPGLQNLDSKNLASKIWTPKICFQKSEFRNFWVRISGNRNLDSKIWTPKPGPKNLDPKICGLQNPGSKIRAPKSGPKKNETPNSEHPEFRIHSKPSVLHLMSNLILRKRLFWFMGCNGPNEPQRLRNQLD